jgi:TolB-like protein
MNRLRNQTQTLVLDWRPWALAALLGLAALISQGCVSTPAQVAQELDQGFTQPLPSPASRGRANPQEEPGAYGEISGPAQDLAAEIGHFLREEPALNRVAVTTFVDVNDFSKTSAFGRAMTDALLALLHRQGFDVIELRKTRSFLIQDNKGEFYLSRNIAHLAGQQNVSAVVVGTYSEALNVILISTRLISAADGQILSTGLAEIPKSRNLAFLLGHGERAAFAQAHDPNRAPGIPAAQVPVLERKAKGPAKVRVE